MAITPQPQRQDEPALTDADLDALLAGEAGPVTGLRPLADVLAALSAAPTAVEMDGETRALAEFRRRTGAPVPRPWARRRTGLLPARLGVKIGGAVAAVTVVIGGVATAAFADALPAPIQRLAHEAFGAPVPPPRHHVSRHGHPGEPGARAAPGQTGAPREGAANKTPKKPKASPHPSATHPSPTPSVGKGKAGNPGTRGRHGNPQHHQGSHGQGQHGKGKGQPATGKGKGSEHNGSGQATAQRGNLRWGGLAGGQPAILRPAGHPRRPAYTRPAMDP